jgi:hypothetical protein
VFFIRHLTLLNTGKNLKFRKSFFLRIGSWRSAGKRAIRSPLAQAVAL